MLAHIFRVHGAVAPRQHEAGALHGCWAVVLGEVLVGFLGHLPHFQKHQRQTPSSLALQHHGGVLPVAVFFNGVDILVGQVDAAGEGNLAVDGDDLPMIPVVLLEGQQGAEGVKYGAFNAHLPELLGKMRGQQEETAEIIVHDPHTNTLGGLAPQYIQDLIPHFAFLDDEKLQENVLLRFLQLGQQCGKHILAQGEIGHPGAIVNGKAGKALQIAHLCEPVGQALLCVGIAVTRQAVKRRGFFPGCVELRPHLPGRRLGVHQQVQKATEDGKRQDQKNPQHLVSALVLFGYDEQNRQNAQQRQRRVDTLGQAASADQHIDEKAHLQHQHQRNEDAAAK